MFKKADLEIYELDVEDIIVTSTGDFEPEPGDWEDPNE